MCSARPMAHFDRSVPSTSLARWAGFGHIRVRFADGWYLSVHEDERVTRLDECRDFEGHLSDVEFRFHHGPLAIRRTDFVAEDEGALFGLVEVQNTGAHPWHGRIGCLARMHLRGGWFSGLESGVTHVQADAGLVIGYDDHWVDQWGLVFGSVSSPDETMLDRDGDRATAELVYDVRLEPGETRHWEFVLVTDHQHKLPGARQRWAALAGTGAALLDAKRALYQRIAHEGVSLDVPDAGTVHEYQLAKVNLHMLTADYSPYLPLYFLGGLPEYPQLFGCDTAYSIAGATAAGFAPVARSALGILGDLAQRAAGRVPHEVTTNGRTWHPGNTQETPQFALAVWDYVRWTGDTHSCARRIRSVVRA